MINRLFITLILAVACGLAVAAGSLVPRGYDAARLLAAADNPARLSEVALEKTFDAAIAAREIEAALTAGDAELAMSFLELARDRHLPVDPGLANRVADAGAAANSAMHGMAKFVRGFIGGEPDDLASLAGTAAGDLFVFGDVRDAIREGARYARGDQVDELILGLACVGLAVTAGSYASLGAGTPARVGLSLVKAARKSGRISAEFSGAVLRNMRETLDGPALKQAFAGGWMQPAVAVRAAREAVKVAKSDGLVRLAGDLGRVQARAGTRAALDGLRLASGPQDVARLAVLAQAQGGKTRAILKLLGRGAIALTAGAFDLAMWIFWAIANLIGLCAALKRATERATLQFIQRGKLRRARSLAAAACSS